MQLFRPTKFSLWETTESALPRVYFGGGKSQQSTSQVSIPPEVLQQYANVNSIAGQVAQTPFQQYSTDPNAFVAPLTATQNAGILGTNQYSNTAQPFYANAASINNGATQGGQGTISGAINQTQAAASPITQSQITNYMNPYEQQVIQPTEQLMQQQFNQAQSQQLGNAIQNGAFGGDRAAVAAANLQQQQALAYGQTLGGLLNQNYSQALGEANTEQQAGLQGANQVGQLGSAYGSLGQAGASNEANIGSGAQAAGLAGAQAQLTAGQAQQQTEQAGLTALYNQFLQQQSYPFQTTQFLANIAEGTGALSGSTTTSNQPAPYFSDERLKEDIEPIGETYDGQKIIKFRYKGGKQKHIGLSAQDVEKTHPHAVGLAGGFKTVDYDAATKASADKGRSHAGGLVATKQSDELSVHGRRNFDYGGYAGLSPNSAAAAGFILDPSYLQTQEAGYANAPWGNAGPVSGAAPYGGKSHVPPSTGGAHGSLAVAKPPSERNSNGLQQLAQGVSQIEGLGKAGKSLFNDAKAYIPGLGGGSSAAAAPQPSGLGIGTGQNGAPPPSRNQPVEANPSPAQPSDASAGLLASNDNWLPDDSGLGALDDVDFAKKGGRIHRDDGGYTNDTPSDQSSGGDVPYESGTGASGLDIPDDHSEHKLATANPPSQSNGGGGGFNPLSLVTPILGIFGLANGGRVGLAGGGDPGDMPLPTLEDAAQPGFFDQGNAPTGSVKLNSGPGKPIKVDDGTVAAPAPASLPIEAPKPDEKRPKAGLNPDAPSPDAQPVQAMGLPGLGGHQTQPGEVLTQDNPGGVGDFLNRNQGLLVPLLHGLGTMASSNSRYLGSAILQGLGGAADSYEHVQDEMQTRLGNQPIVGMRQNELLNAEMATWQAYRAQIPGAENLSFADYERLKGSGQLNSYQGGARAAPNQGAGRYTYTVPEKNGLVLPNGIPANQDPGYMQQFYQHNKGIPGYVGDQAEAAHHGAAEINNQNFTYDKSGNQVTPQGFTGRVLAQNQPTQQTDEANKYRNASMAFNENYQNTSSLLNEMDNIYRGWQAGPTAEWRAQASKVIQDLDPNGQILGHTAAGEDNDKIMKDIGQLTAARLATMSQGAPKDAHDLLNQFAATPDKSPGALRDLIIRGKSYINQMNDYYNGYDPYQDKRSVFQYQKDFFKQHPYDGYRQQLEKATPAYAGQTAANSPTTAQGAGPTGAIPTVKTPADARKLPSGTVFMTPDGRRLVAP